MLRLFFSSQAIILLSLLFLGIDASAQSVNQANGKIVFASKRPYEGKMQWDIYVINADGSGLTNLTKDRFVDSDPEWSSDGSKIVFSSKRRRFLFWWTRQDIFTMNADGTSVVNLTKDLYEDALPAWSPPGAYTYVPDDTFEQNLIELGYDNILDDYVLTENIRNISSLKIVPLTSCHDNIQIVDFMGIQDFEALEEFTIECIDHVGKLDLAHNTHLKRLILSATYVANLNLTRNPCLEELTIAGCEDSSVCGGAGANPDLSNNVNLKKLSLGYVGFPLDLVASVPSIESLTLSGISWASQPIDLRNNPNLRVLSMDAYTSFGDTTIDLRNGANNKLEEITLISSLHGGNVCFQVDDPAHVSSIISTSAMDGEIVYTVTTDCGN